MTEAHAHTARPRRMGSAPPIRHQAFLASAPDRGRQRAADHRRRGHRRFAARPQSRRGGADPRLAARRDHDAAVHRLERPITCGSACRSSSRTTCTTRSASSPLIVLNTFFCVRRRARLRVRDPEAVVRSLSNGWQRQATARPRSMAAPIRSRTTPTTWWWSAPAARACAPWSAAREAGLQDRLHHQGVSDPLAHRRGAGRHRGGARQHGRGRLALAHVRHRQGRRLARRPGRDRIHVPQRAGRGLRARALGPAVLAPRGRRQDLSAPVRRHDHPLRQGHRAAHLRRRRPHRPRHAAHAVRRRRCSTRPNSSSNISPST